MGTKNFRIAKAQIAYDSYSGDDGIGACALQKVLRALSGIGIESPSDPTSESKMEDHRKLDSQNPSGGSSATRRIDSDLLTFDGEKGKSRRRSSRHWKGSVLDDTERTLQNETVAVISSAAGSATSGTIDGKAAVERRATLEPDVAPEENAPNETHKSTRMTRRVVRRKVTKRVVGTEGTYRPKPEIHVVHGIATYRSKPVKIPLHSLLIGDSPVPSKIKVRSRKRSRAQRGSSRLTDVRVRKRSSVILPRDMTLEVLPDTRASEALITPAKALQKKFSELRILSRKSSLAPEHVHTAPPATHNHPLVHRYYVASSTGAAIMAPRNRRKHRRLGGDDEQIDNSSNNNNNRPLTLADFVPDRAGIRAALFGNTSSEDTGSSDDDEVEAVRQKMPAVVRTRRGKGKLRNNKPENATGFFKRVSEFFAPAAMTNSALSRPVEPRQTGETSWLFGRMLGNNEAVVGSSNNNDDTRGFAESSNPSPNLMTTSYHSNSAQNNQSTHNNSLRETGTGEEPVTTATDATATEHTLSQDPFATCDSGSQASSMGAQTNTRKTDEMYSEDTTSTITRKIGGQESRIRGGYDGADCESELPKKPHLVFEQSRSLMQRLKLHRDEITYIKEDIAEIKTMHDSCGLDEVMTCRARAKNRTAFPDGPEINLESETYAYIIVAYKTVLNLWAREYVDEEIERRKLEKKRLVVTGGRLQRHMQDYLITAPDLIYSRDLRLEVQRAEHLLGIELDRVRTMERSIPKIIELAKKVVCSWQHKKYLQSMIQQLAEHLRASPDGDTAIPQMIELLEPTTDPYDFLRLFFASSDGSTISASTPAPTTGFMPQPGHGVNFCEAKKLLHFMQYRHLHPLYKFPKKEKFRGGGLSEEDVSEGIGEAFDAEGKFDLRTMVPKHRRGLQLGAGRMRVLWDRRAKTMLYKILEFGTSMAELERTVKYDHHAPRRISNIFAKIPFVRDLDIDSALVSKPITVEKYGIPDVQTRVPTFV